MLSQVVVALLSIVVLLLGSASAQTIAVPSYIYPGNNDWQLITAAPGKVSFALINPLNGPGFSINNDYVLQTQRTKAAGIPVYGYVHSLYGQASLDVIQKNISTYYSWYPIDGIFVDEAAVDCASVGLYQSVYNFVKAKGGQVVINPGYMTNECYMSTADIVLVAENKWDLYLAPYVPPAWVFKYPASRFWHIVWGVPQSDVWRVINVANSRNAGYVFVTDAGGDNPYNKLPSYWSTLLNKQMYTTGVSLDGGASSSVWTPNIDACDRQCKITAGCTGWTYDVCGGGTCWLTSVGGAITQKTCRAAVQLIASTSVPIVPSGLTLNTNAPVGRYNFGPYGSVSPNGFELDSGSPFGGKADGHSYGWNAANANSFQRSSGIAPSPAHNSGIRMQVDGWWYHWEIAVPAGFYQVHLVAGDPQWPTCQEMAIEGQHVVSGCPTAAAPWVEYTGVISVTDGRLSITNVAGAWSDNKLCFVEIWPASGTILSATVSTVSAKRQSAGDAAANVTFEQRFIDALCEVTHQPPERFRVLKVTPSGDKFVVDYIVLDPDLIPDPNVTKLSTAVATAILNTKAHHWSSAGLRFISQKVVQDQGKVPKRYNKAESITMYVMVGVLGVAVCVLAAVSAYFVYRYRRMHKDQTAVITPSATNLVPTPLSRRPSEMQLLGPSPAGSTTSVVSVDASPKSSSAALV